MSAAIVSLWLSPATDQTLPWALREKDSTPTIGERQPFRWHSPITFYPRCHSLAVIEEGATNRSPAHPRSRIIRRCHGVLIDAITIGIFFLAHFCPISMQSLQKMIYFANSSCRPVESYASKYLLSPGITSPVNCLTQMGSYDEASDAKYGAAWGQ